MYYLVAPLKIARAGADAFTYQSKNNLPAGSLVKIPLGKKQVSGVVLSKTTRPTFATKKILEILELSPLPPALLKTALWLKDYYATPLALVFQTVLPSGLGIKRRGELKQPIFPKRKRTKIVFNKEQLAALKIINRSQPGTILLQGVTGSGKTEVYMAAAREQIKKGKSVIILVPEIALTSQLLAELNQDFGKYLLVTHSAMTPAERHLIWQKCLESKTPLVVVGPRSALFSPLKNLGLIVVDECHESTYKQDQSPRYSALRAASVLAKNQKATLLLGSATPNVVDCFLADKTGAKITYLTKPARTGVKKPTVEVVKLTNQTNFSRHRFLSNQLLASLERNLASGHQTLLFHNRRGSAPVTICVNCSWTAACPRCFTPLVLHTDSHLLRCHTCSFNQKVPTFCPVCNEPDIIHRGIGTKLIVEELTRLFPKAKLARFDSDNESANRLHEQYQDLYDGKIQIIVGTQTVAKGLDLPKLKTVGVIQADNGLSLPDFQAEERVFQLIYQVVGRVGRDSQASEVIVQSYQPAHPSIELGVLQDYETFYKYCLKKRLSDNFPPFCYLLKLTCVYKTESAAIKNSKQLKSQLAAKFPGLQIFGPAPAFYERLNGKFRWQILIKSKSRAELLKIIDLAPKTNWQIDIDPASLL